MLSIDVSFGSVCTVLWFLSNGLGSVCAPFIGIANVLGSVCVYVCAAFIGFPMFRSKTLGS